MNNPTEINIIVQNQLFTLNRKLLTEATDNQAIKLTPQNTLPLPEWVTKQAYLLIVKYLNIKTVSFLKSYLNDNELIVKLLRTADFLSMSKFHDAYITEILIPEINDRNCLVLLEESHKKLKSLDNSQSWFNLLNMSITYLSTHVYEIFNLSPERLKKLNDKIINEVLDRVIRLERKDDFPNKHMLYQLLQECKEVQAGGKQNLCRYLRSTISKKKIHTKIHAKLSWNLKNLREINDKRTKVFKFLDLKWYLCAARVNQTLQVTLNIVPNHCQGFESKYSSSSSNFSENTESEKSLQIKKDSPSASSHNNDEQFLLKNDTFTKIGVFYSKIIWKAEEEKSEKEIAIHYVLMHEDNPIPIIDFDEKMQNSLGDKKVELTIFCNLDQIYSVLLNYIYLHFEGLKLRGNDLCAEELKAMIKVCKIEKKFSLALRFTTELFHSYPIQKRNQELAKGYLPTYMTRMEQDIYANLFGNQVAPENNFQKMKPISTPIYPQKRNVSPIMTPVNYVSKQNANSQYRMPFPKSVSNRLRYDSQNHEQRELSNISTPLREEPWRMIKTGSHKEPNETSLNNSRAESRGSKRKIFSRSKADEKDKDDLFVEMMKVTDLCRYLTPEGMSSDISRILSS